MSPGAGMGARVQGLATERGSPSAHGGACVDGAPPATRCHLHPLQDPPEEKQVGGRVDEREGGAGGCPEGSQKGPR